MKDIEIIDIINTNLRCVVFKKGNEVQEVDW